MKKFFIMLMLLASFINSFSQKIERPRLMVNNEPIEYLSKNLNPNSVGDEFIIGADHFQIGYVFQIIGTTMILLSTNKSYSNFIGKSTVPGVTLNLVGLIFLVESQSHNRKAGKLLNHFDRF